MSEHTPGPWIYDTAMVWGGPQGLTSICEVLFHEDERADEHGPNARLIAAAPELLDALERLLATTVFLDELGVAPAVKRCHAAVKRARGES